MGSAGGKDDRPSFQDFIGGVDVLDSTLQFHACNGDGFGGDTGFCGVIGELLDKIKAGDAGKPRLIVHVGGIEDLPPADAGLQ